MAPNNPLPIWGNEKTMNLNPLILTNIQSSPYFKVNLYELKTYHEVIDEIYYRVCQVEYSIVYWSSHRTVVWCLLVFTQNNSLWCLLVFTQNSSLWCLLVFTQNSSLWCLLIFTQDSSLWCLLVFTQDSSLWCERFKAYINFF
jgi:hypothetical protein